MQPPPLLDKAVLEHAESHMRLGVNENCTKLDEIPFDFERRRMPVVVNERDQRHLLICKGAVEEVLAVCTPVRRGETAELLTNVLRERLAEVTASLNRDGSTKRYYVGVTTGRDSLRKPDQRA